MFAQGVRGNWTGAVGGVPGGEMFAPGAGGKRQEASGSSYAGFPPPQLCTVYLKYGTIFFSITW